MLIDSYEQSVYDLYKHVVEGKKVSVTLLKPQFKSVRVVSLKPFLIFNNGGYYRRWLVKVCMVSGKTKNYLYAIPYDLGVDDPFRKYCQTHYTMLAEYTDFDLNQVKEKPQSKARTRLELVHK